MMLQGDHYVLFTVMVKLLVMASLASVLVSIKAFRSLLFADHKPINDRLGLVLLMAGPFMLGVLIRVLGGYQGADVSMEAAFLIGIVAGPIAGIAAAGIITLPTLFTGELLTPLLATLYGGVAGILFLIQPSQRERMKINPLLPLQLYRVGRDWLKSGRPQWSLLPLVAFFSLQALHVMMARSVPQGLLYCLMSPTPWVMAVVVIANVSCFAIPLKIWNNAWLEMRLQEQEHLLTKARLQALRSQINPHFLFNTLNTILAMIRVDQEQARDTVLKLSKILRSLLREQDEFKDLGRELEMIDSYLSIEESRFGQEKLRIEKRIDPDLLDEKIPSMLLQPLVENCVLHGLSQMTAGGCITIATRCGPKSLYVEIADNGAGLDINALDSPLSKGIGIANVRERLRVIYGDAGNLMIESTPLQGTRFTLKIPYQSTKGLVS